MNKQTIFNIMLGAAAALILAGAILYRPLGDVAPYLLSAGVGLLAFHRLATMRRSENFRVRRLQAIQLLGLLAYGASAYFMFRADMNWVLALAIAAAIELIVALRMPNEGTRS